MTAAVKIVMVEDDHGHAKLIEKNIRRANIGNEIVHFADGGSAVDYLFSAEVRANGPLLILLD
ncbi:MAG: response regulator, partial [Brevundimonas sp.]